VLVAAVFVVLMNFVVDVTYTLVDPRVRLSRR
jgi:ABC-type dipeptide/oligopeptide/nickel transport system permease component